MKSVCFAAFLALVFAASCSEPQCTKNERLVGNICRRLYADGGLAPDDEPGASTETDARVAADAALDARGNPERDGSVDPGTDSSVATAEEASVETGEDATVQVPAADAGIPDAAPTSDPVVDAATGVPPAPPAPACGDAILNGTELCDPKVATGQSGACETDASCKAKNSDPCLVSRVTGDPNAWDVRCETEPKRECKNDDQCCPTGCTSGNDNNCSPSCKNGFVDPGETCEPNVGAGCPTEASCPAPTSCTTAYKFTGDANQCSAQCVKYTITSANKDKKDSCCPEGANANTDLDCTPACGNKVTEAGETCDGNCPTTCAPDGNACTDDRPQGTGCSVGCSYPTITAPAADGCCVAGETWMIETACPVCGNNVFEISNGEQCDDGNFQPNDGCGPDCLIDNNKNILGDERKAEIECGPASCTKPRACRFNPPMAVGCVDESTVADYLVYCDGPEDCAADRFCGHGGEVLTLSCIPRSVLSGSSASDYGVYCHRDTDCAGPKRCLADTLHFTGLGECK